MRNDRRVQATLSALRASADRIASLLAELDDERARRNELVVALVDQETPRKDIAAAGRITPKSICVFLAQAATPGVSIEWNEAMVA